VTARSQPKVHATRRLPERVEAALDDLFDRLPGPAGAAGIVTVPTDPVDGAFLDAAGPQLRCIAQFAVGYDNVDVEAASARGVLVTNTPDVLTPATAELTLALILSLLRRIAEGDRLVRRRTEWAVSPTFMLGRGLGGKTLGIVGYGRIGREVARLAEAHGMRVVYTRRSGGGIPLMQLLAEADVVSLHTPLGDETRHLIGAAELAAMKPGAVLVNTSRGPVVDERALVTALREGTIGGAALDVYEHEPEVPEELLGLENVVLTPHLGSATAEAREAMGMLCVDALRAVLLEGRVPPNALNGDAA
jgi:glyoxylate reductase